MVLLPLFLAEQTSALALPLDLSMTPDGRVHILRSRTKDIPNLVLTLTTTFRQRVWPHHLLPFQALVKTRRESSLWVTPHIAGEATEVSCF
ncbi:hypothetical protein BDW72DRAFT_173167 [Aspergillus terricola var. indicus]